MAFFAQVGGGDEPVLGYLKDLDAARLSRDGGRPAVGDEIGDILNFQWRPKEIKREVTSTWASFNPPGHSNDRLQDGGGGPRFYTLVLDFFRYDGDAPKDYVDRRWRWLESLTCQQYDDNGQVTRGKPHVQFVFGDFINVECVVEGKLSVSFKIFDPSTGYPMHATIELTLREFREDALTISELRR